MLALLRRTHPHSQSHVYSTRVVIIAKSKRELITSETENPSANIQEVVVADLPESTTTPTQSSTFTATYNIEVVVNVHAARTTTSKPKRHLGIMTCSKRKLITPEIPHPPATSKKLL